MRVILGCCVAAAIFCLAEHGREAAASETNLESESNSTASEIFDRRILPIFKSTNPSSCTECHLSSVELRDYIVADQAATFAALVAGGLIDVKSPDDSKILEFIQRAPDKPSLVSAEVRQQEYAAFRAWIVAAVRDETLLAAKATSSVGPKVPLAVVRHARKDRVLDSFVENVWSEINRCNHCHSPEFNHAHVKRFGKEYVDGISWVVPNDPQATLDRLVEWALIDTDAPEESLLLTKPTLQVEHKGGIKMMVGDRGYRQFRRFVDDYAAIAHARYDSADRLPKPNPEVSRLCDQFLRIDGFPADLQRRVLQVEVLSWDQAADRWSDEPCASADWFINRNGFWQSQLYLSVPRGSAEADEVLSKGLTKGRYLARLFLDQDAKQQRGAVVLGDRLELGAIAFDGEWPHGFVKPKVVSFAALEPAEGE